MTCSLDECDNPKYQKTWCRAHYQRWYKHGNPRTLKGYNAWNKGKVGIYSAETLKKISQNNGRGMKGKIGELNPGWLGERAGYMAIHNWVRRHWGTPETCEVCGKTGLTAQKINWANISKKYMRDRSDWLRLCRSCHSKFDRGNEKMFDVLKKAGAV